LQATVTKLAYLLAQTDDLKEIEAGVQTNLRGELSSDFHYRTSLFHNPFEVTLSGTQKSKL
jgi:hypothetical protein